MIILPYVQGKRKQGNVSDGQWALYIFNNFKTKLIDDVLQVWKTIILINLSFTQLY